MLKPRAAIVLDALRHASEGDTVNGFKSVYLDNAHADVQAKHGMSLAAFCGHLSHLEAIGLYRPVDGLAWGEVREPR